MMTTNLGLHCQVRSIDSQTEVISILVHGLFDSSKFLSSYCGCVDSVFEVGFQVRYNLKYSVDQGYGI